VARAHGRTLAVILGTAVAAFLAAWWLSPVAAGSGESLTTVGVAVSPTISAETPAEANGAMTAHGVGVGESARPTVDHPDKGPARSLFVHVSGAVTKPGLVEVPDGARVFDAIAQAGGLTAEAREGGVNLARFVVDGEQIFVPRSDDPAAAAGISNSSTAGGTRGGGSSASAGPPGTSGKVNLNTATAAELETLPRVGPALSAKILAWRTDNGAFSAIEDLNDVDGVGDKTFESLKDLVTL